MAVKGDRFLAAGTSTEMRRLAGPRTRIVDLKGRFVSPGLTDAHFHSEGGGSAVDLSKAATISDIQAALRKAAASARPGEVITTNRDWHEMQLKEQRLPTAAELDVGAPSTPVVVKRGGHSYILNNAALRKWNITASTSSPAGGQISKDTSGALTGELFDNAKSLVTLPPDPPVTTKDVLTTQRVLNSYGITSVRVIGGYKTDPSPRTSCSPRCGTPAISASATMSFFATGRRAANPPITWQRSRRAGCGRIRAITGSAWAASSSASMAASRAAT